MRRFMSAILVLCLMLSVLPFVAFADDGVAPCAEATPCPNCGKAATVQTTIDYGQNHTVTDCSGTNNPMVHQHQDRVFVYYTHCSYCGYSNTRRIPRVYCFSTKSYL